MSSASLPSVSTASAPLSAFQLECIDQLIDLALKEDLSSPGDVTTKATIDPTSISEAYFLAKADGVISGIEIAKIIVKKVHEELYVNFTVEDGTYVTSGTKFGTVIGPTYALLVAERLLLNVMQRMSGIASYTYRMVQLISSTPSLHHKRPTRLLDTRKTVPGLRVLDKLAVTHGGGYNHRMGLYDMVMIKDNHITAAGGVKEALEKVHYYMKASKHIVPIEIETRTLEEVKEAMTIGGFQRIMLDNMVKVTYDEHKHPHVDTSMLVAALQIINGAYETEASGNVNEHSIHEISKSGVDFISCGALTHSVTALDISLKIS